MPAVFSVSMATPLANGFTVEPRQPTPAPSSTVPTATMVSKPAATMVSDNSA